MTEDEIEQLEWSYDFAIKAFENAKNYNTIASIGVAIYATVRLEEEYLKLTNTKTNE